MRFVSILFCLPQNSHFTFKINSSSRNEIFLLHSVCGLTSDYTSEAGNKCSGGATGAAQHVTDKWLVSRHQSAYPGWDRIHVGAGIYWAGTSLWFHWLLHAACREKKKCFAHRYIDTKAQWWQKYSDILLEWKYLYRCAETPSFKYNFTKSIQVLAGK